MAACLMGHLACRRGAKQLRRVIAEMEGRLGSSSDLYYHWAKPEFEVLGEIFLALGRADTAEAHQVIAEALSHPSHVVSRWAALDGTAFEERCYDFDLVTPFLSAESHEQELLNALYSLECHDYAKRRPKDARSRIAPLLKHPSGSVRSYAVRALSFGRGNRQLILGLSDDMDPLVIDSIETAKSMWGV